MSTPCLARSADVRHSVMTSLSFSAPSHGAGYFPFGESNQSQAPGTTVSATSCCLNFPALLAPSGPARTRPSLASDMRALLPLGAAMLGVMQGRGKGPASLPVIHDLVQSEIRWGASPVCARRKRADRGPSNTASGRRKCPLGGAQEVRQFAAGTWMCRREPRRPGAKLQHRDVRRACSRGGLLFGDLSLGHARESHPRARGARGKNRIPLHHSEAAACIRAMDRDQNSRFCAAHR